ncbi:hypothetical protein ACGTN6_18070 [Halomonas sp. THAF12]|uniref:hypothetical protein n=1 Tax=Halomonas sp. B23F22_10 TaxID=3459515 RepID=UPI00373F8FC3
MIKSVIRTLRSSTKTSAPVDVVLHIGAPKCGSSAIQRFCVSHRDKLLALGYYYPEHTLDINGVSGGHTQVAGPLLSGKQEQAGATFQRWLNEARGHQATLMLSAEAFYGQHEAMAEICQGLRVKVIGFLRHPVDYLLANHNQGIKRHHSTRRLGALLPEFLGRPAGHLAGLPLIQWAEAFRDENCCFMAYQSPSAGGATVQGRFLQALGLSDDDVSSLLEHSEGITNRSYVKSALELKRLLNTVLEGAPDSLAHQVDWSLQGYSDRAQDEYGYTVADLTREMRERLEQHLLKQMTPVVERFPELKAAAEMPREGARTAGAGGLDLRAPLAALQADAPKAVQEIRLRAVELRDQGRQEYAFCKLLDILGIEFSEPAGVKPTPGLTEHQRKTLSKDNAGEADYLRELAVLLERQELLEDALFAIERALSKRPTGLGIQNIKARIEKKMQSREAGLKALTDRTAEASDQ